MDGNVTFGVKSERRFRGENPEKRYILRKSMGEMGKRYIFWFCGDFDGGTSIFRQ
jgi:hypothetical protein